MAENTQSVLERTAADQWKVLPSGLTVLVRPMPGYSGTHVIYATRFGSIDRDFRLGEREVHLPAGVAHFLEHSWTRALTCCWAWWGIPTLPSRPSPKSRASSGRR